MDLNEAKQSFVELMQLLNRTDQRKFLTFIMEEWKLESSIVCNDSGLLYFDCTYIFIAFDKKKSEMQASRC